MAQRMRRSPETIFTHVLLVVIFLGLISLLKSHHEASTHSLNSVQKRTLETRDQECRIVHSQPNQCNFVKENCPDEEAGLFSYLQLYFCSLADAKWLAFIIMAIWISILFSTIGIAASDFLCLNLSTIASIMGMSESLAGVTFLAFGNGSPDVFSTFAAFSSHSGSLAVGELMGAAGFITAVVAGSMAITKPFRVAKKAFVRDVTLFAIAAGFSLNFLKDGSLRMWECIVMVGFYVVYVIFVVAWHWWFERRRRIKIAEAAARLHQHIPDQQELDVPDYEDDEESRPAAERTPLIRSSSGVSIPSAYGPATPAWVVENVDEDDDETRDQYLATLSSNMRVSRPTRDRRNTITPIRPSLIGALEFRSVLNALERKSTNAQPIYMRRYSDDGRGDSTFLQQLTDPQLSASQPALARDHGQQSNADRSRTTGTGRGRAASAYDTRTLKINRDLLDVHAGTPETAIYAPKDNDQPRASTLDIPRGNGDGLLSPITQSSTMTSPGSITPKTATRNGLLAPPVPAFQRPEYTADDRTHSGTGSVSPGSLSPLALVPKLQIPDLGQKSPQELNFALSPLAMSPSATASPPPSIHLPPPSMSPDSARLYPLPEDDIPQHQFRWWPYKYFPTPEVIFSTLFPGLCQWQEKSWPDRVLAVFTAPTIFLLTLTVPVVETKAIEDEVPGEVPLITSIPASPSRSRSPTVIRLPASPRIHARSQSTASVPHIASADAMLELTPKDWGRWLYCVQAFTAPFFTVLIAWANFDEEGDMKLLLKLILGSLIFSLVALGVLITITSPDREPKHKPVMCFLGFFVAIAWISTIAGEVVGVLKAFGVILNISDAILGLTIFAVGNSLGDLVADITVARLGFPMMALSACFGGPMLNILLGIGIGGLYQTIMHARRQYKKHPQKGIHYKPYELDISTTLLVSGATLLVTLVFLLIVVPLNNWRMDRKIGTGLIAIWTVSTILNVVLEITGMGHTELSFGQ